MNDTTTGDTATRVVLTYDPGAIDDISRYWVEDELSKDSYQEYVRRTYDEVSEGDEFEEFVSKGCSVPMEVTLRVDSRAGGSTIGEVTDVEIRRRD